MLSAEILPLGLYCYGYPDVLYMYMYISNKTSQYQQLHSKTLSSKL